VEEAKTVSEQQRILLHVEGMTCDSCAAHVTRALKEVPGVMEVSVPGWRSARAEVVATPDVSDEALAQAVAAAGYRATTTERRPLIAEGEPRGNPPSAVEPGMVADGRSIALTDAIGAGKRGFRVGVVAFFALLVAVVGSVVTGTNVSVVTAGVESLVTVSNTFLGNLADAIPLGYAFGAGMVAAVNPCGFAMLPAYLGLYLGTRDPEGLQRSVGRRLAQALLVSLLVTAGFVLLFGVAGLLISAGARAIIAYVPWIGLLIGVLLIAVGAWLLGGGTLYTSFGDRVAAEIGRPTETSVKGYFLFGLSYGIASLSCTLPVFLTVVGGTVTAGGFLGASFQFVMYALGMGFVILVLTVGIALFKGAVVGTLRRALPYVQSVGAILLVIAGAYIVYYWLTLGGLLKAVV